MIKVSIKSNVLIIFLKTSKFWIDPMSSFFYSIAQNHLLFTRVSLQYFTDSLNIINCRTYNITKLIRTHSHTHTHRLGSSRAWAQQLEKICLRKTWSSTSVLQANFLKKIVLASSECNVEEEPLYIFEDKVWVWFSLARLLTETQY